MTTYHEFDQEAIEAVLEAARNHHEEANLGKMTANSAAAADGHISFGATCISVTVEDGKVCLNLPLGIGKVCLPIPSIIPSGTAAEACLHICTTFGIPTGVRVTVSVAGKVIVQQSFGKC